jgi:hypothetical protein
MSYSPETEAWAMRWPRCWVCAWRAAWGHGAVIHHIVRGSSRHKDDLTTTLFLCGTCHDKHHLGEPALTLPEQLALKRHFDPKHYDLAHVCRLRGRAPTSIVEADVDAAAASLREKGILP